MVTCAITILEAFVANCTPSNLFSIANPRRVSTVRTGNKIPLETLVTEENFLCFHEYACEIVNDGTALFTLDKTFVEAIPADCHATIGYIYGFFSTDGLSALVTLAVTLLPTARAQCLA